MIKREIPKSIDADILYDVAKSVLDLSKEGLKERELGEEVFLDSLYENIEERTNPGKRVLDYLSEGKDLEELIKEYGDLN